MENGGRAKTLGNLPWPKVDGVDVGKELELGGTGVTARVT